VDRPVVATTFYVRYAETDQMGLVHHSAYLIWFEEGRSQYMRACGADYAEIERSGALFAVAEAHARYEAPARYGDRVTVRTWVEEIRSRSITFGYAVYNADTGQPGGPGLAAAQPDRHQPHHRGQHGGAAPGASKRGGLVPARGDRPAPGHAHRMG